MHVLWELWEVIITECLGFQEGLRELSLAVSLVQLHHVHILEPRALQEESQRLLDPVVLGFHRGSRGAQWGEPLGDHERDDCMGLPGFVMSV